MGLRRVVCPAMTEILVTGGTGELGRQLVPKLLEAGHGVRVLSRSERPELPPGVRAVRGDLATGDGLTEAVAGADAIAHCATSPLRKPRDVDVGGTKRLLDRARAAGCRLFLYISIVGIDRVPYPYYGIKLDAERAIEASRVPHTILRATQFHDLIVRVLLASRRLPFTIVPRGFVFQPVDTSEVASKMVQLLSAEPLGHAADMAGPEVRRIEDLARSYITAARRRNGLLRVPIPGKAGRAFRAGLHTDEHAGTVGTVTWEDFLRRRFGPPANG